jgi:hypothetical protein
MKRGYIGSGWNGFRKFARENGKLGGRSRGTAKKPKKGGK